MRVSVRTVKYFFLPSYDVQEEITYYKCSIVIEAIVLV